MFYDEGKIQILVMYIVYHTQINANRSSLQISNIVKLITQPSDKEHMNLRDVPITHKPQYKKLLCTK